MTVGYLTKMNHMIMQRLINRSQCRPIFRAFTSSIQANDDHHSMKQSTLVLPTKTCESINNQTQVSVSLANHLFTKKFQNENVVFSPLSIQVVLGLLAPRLNGRELDQLLLFLKTNNIHDLNALASQLVCSIMSDGSPNGGPCLNFANGVWDKQTLGSSYKQVVETVYHATYREVGLHEKPDKIAKEVNLWAEKQTNGLIKDILSPEAVGLGSALFILANAVYFKGVWIEKFDSSKTKDHNFQLNNGSKVRVPFMTSKEDQFVAQYDNFKVLGLPYVHGKDKRRFTMYFFLPDEKDGLQSLIQKVSSETDFLKSHTPSEKVEVGRFLIPKFKMSFGFSVIDKLNELGLRLPSTIDGKECAFNILHKSFLEVNEEGTEAAAVTTVVCYPTSLCQMPVKVDFVADHPFMFVIREDTTGVVLFMGQVNDPRIAG